MLSLKINAGYKGIEFYMKNVIIIYIFHGKFMLRLKHLDQIDTLLTVFPGIALLGPRQCGKTTLARDYIESNNLNKSENYFDLENPLDLARLEDPMTTLSALSGTIVIDEIQRKANLFPILRVLIDNNNLNQKYLILGSASRELIKQSSETLAGRIAYTELTPFSYPETHDFNKMWLRGGFPRSFLAESDETSFLWRQHYIKTFLEQDIPLLGITIPAEQLRRFWMMLAHYHGNILNASELGRSLGVSHVTIQSYIDILQGTFMVRRLQPWFANISKRQVKSPKIYFRDSGIYHSLMNISNHQSLLVNPKLGASWEGIALEEIIRKRKADSENCYFWATHQNAELDLLLIENNKLIGFEFKYTDVPKMTKSMRIALEDLKLDELNVIYPGNKNFILDKKINVLGLVDYLKS